MKLLLRQVLWKTIIISKLFQRNVLKQNAENVQTDKFKTTWYK